MKKFLSLVLAMIMALSLVTISAGAVEYSELTDKDEIQFEEAVAVLNKIGIIEGYPDGSYRPDAPLTRQVAAKFIVSLLIGPEAAKNLTAAVAPYPDVPVSSDFAGYISYCKTANIISGYSDGTFKPEASLTGYAFSKMLLGAIGYKSDIEGFTGTGWTMNVARIGNAANLFNRIEFQGGETVNRETAAQLCLNTLKATMVEYSGGFNITSGDATIVGAQTRSYVTSNQTYAANISNRKVSDQTVGGATDRSAPYTVEFGEEHFKDLRLNYDGTSSTAAIDAFGRPSNEWSWKKVTFGTFPLDPDFEPYTTQVAHDVDDVTDASKLRALGLNGYKVEGAEGDTEVYINGNYEGAILGKVADIADLTDNGTIVEIYVSDTEADFIRTVVVIKTQMMEVKRIGSDFVVLDRIDPDNKDNAAKNSGYNQEPLHVKVEDVEEDNVNYSFLKGLKTEDLVAVIPVAIDHDEGEGYEVDTAYTPEEVTGKLTRVDTYGKTEALRQATTVTVGGTKYPVALWNKDLVKIKADDIKVTRDDVKLYLDMFGNALRAKNVGATSNFMVIKGYYDGLENGKLVHYVEGWDIKGNELSLNIGSNVTTYNGYTRDHKPGDLVFYTNEGAVGTAEWKLSDNRVGDIDTGDAAHKNGLAASNVRLYLTNLNGTPGNKGTSPYYTADNMKFIYVTFDDDGDVDSIEVLNHVQKTSKEDLDYTYNNNGGAWNPAQGCLDKDFKDVEAVVIKKESNEAISSSVLYISNYNGEDVVDDDGTKVYGYEVAMMSKDGLDPDVDIYGNRYIAQGQFASYAASERAGFEPFYNLKRLTSTQKATSVIEATVQYIVNADRNLVRLTDYVGLDGDRNPLVNISGHQKAGLDVNNGDEANIVDLTKAEWLDLYSSGHIDSVKDLRDAFGRLNGSSATNLYYPVVKLLFNDDPSSSGFRMVSMVVIVDETGAASAPVDTTNDDTSWIAYFNGSTVPWTTSDAAGSSTGGTGTASDPFTYNVIEMHIGASDVAKTFQVVPNEPFAKVALVAPLTEPTGWTTWAGYHTFDVTASDGTVSRYQINIVDDASGGVIEPIWEFAMHGQVGSAGSTNINVYMVGKAENTGDEKSNDHWINKTNIQGMGLKPEDFTLTVGSRTYHPTELKYGAIRDDIPSDPGGNQIWTGDGGYVKLVFADRYVDSTQDMTVSLNVSGYNNIKTATSATYTVSPSDTDTLTGILTAKGG